MAPSAGTLRVGRYFAVLVGLFVVLYAAVFWPHAPRTPKLGLDLEGGAQVVLKAETTNGKAPSATALDQARQIIENRVNGLGVSSAQVVKEGNDRIVVSVPGAGANDIKNVGGTALLQFRPLLPIYDSTGAEQQSLPVTTASATPSASASASSTAKPTGSAVATAKPASSAAASATASTSPQGRVVPRAAGSATPTVTPSGSATPLATGSASSTAKAPVTGSATASPSPSASSTTGASDPIDQWKVVGFTPPTTPAAVAALSTTQKSTLYSAINSWPCNNVTTPLDVPTKPIITCDQGNTTKYLLGPVIVTGTEVKDASAQAPGSQSGQFSWTVSLDLKPKGQAAWADYTSKHNVTVSPDDIGNTVADTLDSKVIVASTIQQTITTTTQISGSTIDETAATNLANSLKYGALPLTFSQQTAQTVSATLGTDQLKAGLLAGGIGLALVVIYSLIYYRALGLVTIASLIVSGGLTYAMLVILGKQIGFTLTLAGIAGFIVAVGITADSFVVFFERIKDEVHEGRTARTAIPRAWERSRRTILSADTVSFLAAATLYYFAAGDVKGFAFTLGLSTILDLVVVFLFTHPLVSLFSRSSAFGSAKFTGLNHVRDGGIPSRNLVADDAELVSVGGRASSGEVPDARPSSGASAVGSSSADRAASRRARAATSTTESATAADTVQPAATDETPLPAGATAAERAAARRGRKPADPTTEDDA